MTKIRTRYAPSPTGRMQVGNLRSALYEFLYVLWYSHAYPDIIKKYNLK